MTGVSDVAGAVPVVLADCADTQTGVAARIASAKNFFIMHSLEL